MEASAGAAVLGAWIFAAVCFFTMIDNSLKIGSQSVHLPIEEQAKQEKLGKEIGRFFTLCFVPSALLAVAGTVMLLDKS